MFFDGIGGRAIRKQTLRTLSDAGISVGVFFPALFGKLHLRMNYRNHRKIIVIDGICGYIGGFNIGDEYLGLNPKFGYWRDTHLKLSGEAVFDLQLRFAMDWHYATGENLFRQQQYFEIFKHPDGKSGVQIISSGPDSKYEEIKTNILQLIHKAKQYIYPRRDSARLSSQKGPLASSSGKYLPIAEAEFCGNVCGTRFYG
jgi:cardiolipin synthase